MAPGSDSRSHVWASANSVRLKDMRVFHLTHADHALGAIVLRRLKIARIADLNDPFELLAANLGGDKPLRKRIREWRLDLHKTTGLLCFSRDWNSPVLWSHYADKHRGICLGFELRDNFAEAVTYVEGRLPVPTNFLNVAPALSEPFVRQVLTTKYLHWKYENEVRTFVKLDERTAERGLYFFPFSDDLRLTEVILGPLCELPLDTVRSFVDRTDSGAIVIRARLGFKSFNVVPLQWSLLNRYVSPVDGSSVEHSKDDE
jgi:hypothetical protein